MVRKMMSILLLVLLIFAISHSFCASHMGSAQAAESMTITSATVTFSVKKKDALTLKGMTGSFSLTGATSVIFEAGPFKQEIALDTFKKSKEKYTFKAAAGQTGLTSLILDMAKGQFSAKVQNVFLTGFTNPLAVRLTAGTSAGCSMIQLGESKGKWTFSGTSNPQYGCLISQTPQATPMGLFVNKATGVTVQVQVPSHGGLNENSIGLFRVDSNLKILGGPLCGLLDNGNLINGDQTAGDRIFSCFANFQEGTAGKMFFLVGAELGGKMTYSPSFSLDVVVPYTEQQAQQTVASHQQAGEKWEQNLTKYGDSEKARTETVKAVNALEGIKDAGVSSDGVNIWIEFTSGIKGGLLLSQEEETSANPFAGSKERAEMKMTASTLSVQPTSCKQESDTAGGTSSAGPVGNCGVLFWDRFAYGFFSVDISAFESNPSEKFWIVKEYGDEDGKYCDVDSLREITQYGTVIIRTPGYKDSEVPFYATNEIVTLPKLAEDKYMLDLLTGCLKIVMNKSGELMFYFTPSFISTLEGQFDKSIVYVGAHYSSELASAFLSKGVHTFFGYSGEPEHAWRTTTEQELFTSMVKDGMDTGEAYAALPSRSDGNSLFLKYSSSVEEIAYGKKGCYHLMWEEGDFPAGALNGTIEIQTELTRLQYTVVKPLLSMFVYVTSHVSGKAETEWEKMKDGAMELAEQTNSILLVNDADFILLGNNSLNPGGGYAPGGWGYFFYKGNIIEVLSFRCFYNGYDTNCADARLTGLTLNALSALFIEEKDRAAGVIEKRCGTSGCID